MLPAPEEGWPLTTKLYLHFSLLHVGFLGKADSETEICVQEVYWDDDITEES